MASPVNEPLRVIVVGAGIGGLAAALALRRDGHIVQIFEQSHFSAEVGAAVGMFPNATRVLGKLGCELERMAVVPNHGMKMYSAADGKVVMDVDTSKSDEPYGSPSVFVHRVDLHSELRRLATEGEGGATLNLGARVTQLDPDAGRITLANGQTHTADVVIAADGIHSVTQSAITGTQAAPIFSGKSAFRFTVPREKLASNTATKSLLEGRTVVHVVNGGRHIMLLYPCRAGTLLNCICFHPDPAGATREGWSTPAKVEDIIPHFEHFAPMFMEVIKLATDVKLYPQSDSTPHATWIRGRSALLGDAAHAMLPYQAQGATQALEDALALGVILKGASPADVPFRLRIYEHVRKSRADAMQYLSRAQAAGIEQGVTRVSPLELMSFTAAHDVHKYAEQAMTAFWPIPAAET